MAQLAAIEKGLYYPTDVGVIRTWVEKHVTVNEYTFTAVDPCSGEGLALKTFTDAIRGKTRWRTDIDTIGFEIEKNRAEAGKENLTKSIHSAFEDLDIDGHADLIWMNPPYDDMKGKRAEIFWIDMVAPLLTTGRMMVLVLPQRFVKGHQNHDDLRLCLARNQLTLVSNKNTGTTCGAFKFPDPEFNQFKQYIIVVEKNTGRVKVEPEIFVEGVIGECDSQIELRTNYNSSYSSMRKSTLSILPRTAKKIESQVTPENFIKFTGDPDSEIPVTPLQPMIDEILAAVIAGGMFSGIKIGENVVRGGVERIWTTTETVNENDTGKEIVETEKMVATVSTLSLVTGNIETYNSSQTEFGVHIEAIARVARDMMHEHSPSVYQEDMLERFCKKFEKVHAPKAVRGKQNGLFPAQKRAVSMILKGWENNKAIILLGKMGTGKTITSIAASVAQVINRKDDAQKIVILLPAKNDLVKKWKDEIRLSCRDLKPNITDVESISDVQKAFAMKGLTFIIVKESMLKRTSGWNHLKTIWNPKDDRNRHICWKCGKDTVLVTEAGNQPEKQNLILYCKHCKVKYTTDTRDQNGNAYASLARYINKHYAKSYVVVMDEAHQFKGGDTARGYASANLIRGAWRVLGMTGTFYNGLASSMFYTLYRTQGSFREMHTYDGVQEFVELYGLIEKKTNYGKDEKYSWQGYKQKGTRIKELPGIHPSMVAMMLPYTVFMKIEDFGTPEYEKIDRTLFVDLPADVEKKTTVYLTRIREQAITEMKDKENRSMSLMSQLTHARAGVYCTYPLGDYVTNEVLASYKHNELKAMRTDELAPLEEALLRYVQKVWKKGYPTLVYYMQTDRRPVHGRLSEWFEKYGMKLAFMPSSVNSKIDFINSSLRNGAHAIICNPNLVREGIDLLQFGGIFWYGATQDAVLVDQANARIYRPLIQDHHVEIVYGGYNGTYQSEQWTVTAKKLAGMAAVHGDIRKGLASLLGEADLIDQIQEQLIQFERHDSQWTMKDLPELEVFEKPSPIDGLGALNFDDVFYSVRADEPIAVDIPTVAQVDDTDLAQFNLFSF